MKKFSFLTFVSAALVIYLLPAAAVDPSPGVDKKAAAQRIDELVSFGLEKHQLEPNASIDEAAFLRRAYLDIAGRVPTIEEAESFIRSTYDRKREQIITELLESEGHVSHAYNFWADILRINTNLGNASLAGEAAYQLWVKEAIRSNKPYDQMVRELVSATGKIWDNGAIGYYLRDLGMPLDNMSNTVRVFLGTRLECAQCHNHPFDKWKQMDYFQMAAFSYGMDARNYDSANRQAYTDRLRQQRSDAHKDVLERAGYSGTNFPNISNKRSLDGIKSNRATFEKYLTRLKMDEAEFMKVAEMSIDAQEKVAAKNRAGDYALGRIYQQVRYFAATEKEKPLKLPHDYQYSDAKPHDSIKAATMFGAEIDLEKIDDSAVRAYAEWMTAKDNPTFAKVIANRLWKRVFGHGVIEPVDELTDHTYVANPELMSYLVDLMKDLDFDMRSYLEILYNTNTYQRASYNGEILMGAPYHFQGPVLRRMTAEQIWDSIVALALPEADNYRPRLKSQLTSIEMLRRNYLKLEDQSPEEYLAMVDELANAVGDLALQQEEARQKMYAAREAKDEILIAEWRKEVSRLAAEERKTIQEIAFNYTKEKLDPTILLASLGMTEMSGMSEHNSDGGPKAENLVMTQLPKIKMEGKPPKGLTPQEGKKWLDKRKADQRSYQSLVSTMARASELESPARRGHFLREFGQSDREVIENAAHEASVPQALNLLNGPIVEALTNQYAVFGHRIHTAKDTDEKVKMIFQAMLTREPTEREMSVAKAEIETQGGAALEGIVWALLNTQQFIFVQ